MGRLELINKVRGINVVADLSVVWIEAAVVVAADAKKITANHGNIIRKARVRDAEIVHLNAVLPSERVEKRSELLRCNGRGINCVGSISLKDDDHDPIEMRRRGLRHDFRPGSDSVNYCEADNTNHRGNGEIFGSQMHYRPC